jgi:hypothetical protein
MRGRASTIAVYLVALVTVGLGIAGWAHSAMAAVIQIPAVGFVLRCSAANCPPDGSARLGEQSQGLLLNARGTYFSPVVFPNFAERVCRFVLWARDNDGDINVTARLMRKRLATTNAFAPPEVMAQVSSTGANPNLRAFIDSTIAAPLPNASFVYYVELVVPGETLEVAGVRIETRPTC